MPGTSLGVGGPRQRPQLALLTAALAILGVVVAATWFNDRNPAVSSSTFARPVTLEAVIVDEGRTTQGGNTVCGPAYRFELEGRTLEAATGTKRSSRCAPVGTTRLVTVDAADPTRVIDPAVEHGRSMPVVVAVGVVAAPLLVAALLRWRARRVGDDGVGPGTSGGRGWSSGSSRRHPG